MKRLINNSTLNKLPIAMAGLLNPTEAILLDHIARRCSIHKKVYIPIEHLQEGVEGWNLPLLRSNGKPIHRNTIKKARDTLVNMDYITYEKATLPNGDGTIGLYSIHPKVVCPLVSILYKVHTSSRLFSNILIFDVHHTDDSRDRCREELRQLAQEEALNICSSILPKHSAYIYGLLLSIGQVVGSSTLYNVRQAVNKLVSQKISRETVHKAFHNLESKGFVLTEKHPDTGKLVYYIHNRPWGDKRIDINKILVDEGLI